MNIFSEKSFVKINYVKVRLWFSKLMHLSPEKQNKKIYKKRILNTKQVDQLNEMLDKIIE